MSTLLDPGTYRGRALEGALGATTNGKDQVAVRFDLLDFPGQSITWFGFFTEKTETSTLKALRTAGWKGMDLADLSDLSDPECPEVYLVIEHDTYTNPETNQTKTSARVRWVNSAQGLAMTNRLAPDKAKILAARMREKLAALDALARQNGEVPKPAARKPPPADRVPHDVIDAQAEQHGSDDEIPF
jgi:hypothetical protein